MDEVNTYQFQASKQHSFVIYYGTDEDISKNLLPHKLSLGDIYPNPASELVNIPLTVPEIEENNPVAIKVFNLHGTLIKTINNSTYQPGFHQIQWDCTTDIGVKAIPGVYFISLQAEGIQEMKRIILN
jgi:flagellar hook assembly protein FlgD